MDNIAKIKDAAARKQAAKWYERTWNAVADTYKTVLSKMGWNKARLDGIDAMRPEDVVSLVADEMLKGRTLGEVKRVGIDMSKSENLGKLHDRKTKDWLRPIEDIEKEAGKTKTASAHTLFRLVPGKVQAAINDAEAFANYITDKCKKVGVNVSELNEFLYAQGAGERNAKILRKFGKIDGSAMNVDDIELTMEKFKNAGKYDKLKELADEVLKFQNDGFDMRVESGLIGAEEASELRAEEKHHVPMKSRFDSDGNHTGFDPNVAFGRREFHEAKGRTNIGDGPLEWILQEYVDAKSRASVNEARKSLLTTVLQHPEIGSIRLVKGNEKSGEISRKGMVGNPNVFTVKNLGKTYEITLNGKRGELVAAAVTGRNVKRANKLLQKAMRWWSSTATEWSPTFSLRNALADTIDVFAVNVGEHGIIKGTGRNIKHAYTSIGLANDIRKYISSGKTENPILKEAIDAGVLMLGGVRGQAFDANENALNTLKSDFAHGKNRAKSLGKFMFGWVGTLNQTAELMNRMADYKIQRDAGMSKNEAALHAREITVDFNEKGEWTPYTNLAYMFSNSSLGATMRLNKALFSGKHGAELAASAFALGMLEGYLEAENNGEDEDGKNMSERDRANSIYVRNGNDVIRDPIHTSPISIIKYAGNCAVRKMMGTLPNDEFLNQIADDMIGIMTQYLGIGSVNGNVVSSVVPSIIQPFVQMLMNKDYAGRPIENTPYDKNAVKSHNGRKNTPEEYKRLAELINELTGGNEGRRGKVDFSPEMYKYISENIGKNVLKDASNVYELVKFLYKKSTEDNADIDRREIPYVRDYYRSTGDNTDRYFKANEAFDKDKKEYNDHVVNQSSDERKKYIVDHPWLLRQEQLNSMKKRIDELRHYENNKVKTGHGYRDRPKPFSQEQIDKFKEMRLELQAKYIELLEKKSDKK